jgi:hypothetical protein
MSSPLNCNYNHTNTTTTLKEKETIEQDNTILPNSKRIKLSVSQQSITTVLDSDNTSQGKIANGHNTISANNGHQASPVFDANYPDFFSTSKYFLSSKMTRQTTVRQTWITPIQTIRTTRDPIKMVASTKAFTRDSCTCWATKPCTKCKRLMCSYREWAALVLK